MVDRRKILHPKLKMSIEYKIYTIITHFLQSLNRSSSLRTTLSPVSKSSVGFDLSLYWLGSSPTKETKLRYKAK